MRNSGSPFCDFLWHFHLHFLELPLGFRTFGRNLERSSESRTFCRNSEHCREGPWRSRKWKYIECIRIIAKTELWNYTKNIFYMILYGLYMVFYFFRCFCIVFYMILFGFHMFFQLLFCFYLVSI